MVAVTAAFACAVLAILDHCGCLDEVQGELRIIWQQLVTQCSA